MEMTTTLDDLHAIWQAAVTAENRADRKYRRLRNTGTQAQVLKARQDLHTACRRTEDARRTYLAARDGETAR